MSKLYNFQVPMSSPVYEVTEKLRSSSARYVKNVRVGDKIRFANSLYANLRMASRGGHYATECCIIRLNPDGTEEVIAEAYTREVQKAYFTGSGEFDYEGVNRTCDLTPVFRIEEV